MIIKIAKKAKAAVSTAQVIQYNFKEKSDLVAIENYYKEDLNSLIPYIDGIEKSNTRIKYPNFHVILSFAPGVFVEDNLAKEIIKEYMDKMGYGNQPYCIFRHSDKAHLHFHTLTTRVSVENYKKIDHDYEKQRSNTIRQELEKKYQVTIDEQNQTIQPFTETLTESPSQVLPSQALPIVNDLPLKQEFGNIIEGLMTEVRPSSLEELSLLLRERGIVLEKLTKGIVFYHLENRRRAIGSSGLDCFRERSLYSQLNDNLKEKRIRIKGIIAQFKRDFFKTNQGSKDPIKFINEYFCKEDIEVKFSRNNSGGIYGMSFKSGLDLIKGSSVKFSYNDFTKLINRELHTATKKASRVGEQKRGRKGLLRIAPGGGGRIRGRDDEDEEENDVFIRNTKGKFI